MMRYKAGIPRRRHRHRHGNLREDPREDVGEDVGLGVGVGVVECRLNKRETRKLAVERTLFENTPTKYTASY